MRSSLLIIFFLSLFTNVFSQENDATPDIVLKIIEQMSENSEEEIDFTQLQDDLQIFSESPINLNTASKEELERLHFLSDIQIENLLYYLYRFAPMYSIYELQLVESLDTETIRNLLPFVTLLPNDDKLTFNLPFLFKNPKQEIFLQSRYTLEQKTGYENTTNSNNYLGEPFYGMFKYRFQSRNRLLFGFTAEKDEGEPFWNKHHKGFDFYSAHLQMNDVGKFKRIVIGDYRAGFGYGLVMNNNFGMGKSSYVLNVLPTASGLNKTTSTNEYNFFRGVGSTIRFGDFDISVFYSYRKLDGSLAEDGVFSSFKTDGLHRTQNDWDKKNVLGQQVLGGNVTYSYHQFKTGFTWLKTTFSHSVQPIAAPYNLYYFRGKEQLNASVDYNYLWQRIKFFGETAIDSKASVATLNGMLFSPNSRVGLIVLQRFYSKSYQSFFANSFGEASLVNNEQGIYLGAEVRPIKYWKLSAYVDSFRFPWLKYGIDKPSDGYDVLFQADYSPKRNVSMYTRYKYKEKQKNFMTNASPTNIVEDYDKSTFKYVLKYQISRFVHLQNTLEFNEHKNYQQAATNGFLISQDMSVSCESIPLKFDFRYAFFDAANYDNRIYMYEKDVLYAFSIPMYYGKGTRMYVNISYSPLESLSFWFKLAYTKYLDKEEIGSALETIQANHKTDMKLMMRWKF